MNSPNDTETQKRQRCDCCHQPATMTASQRVVHHSHLLAYIKHTQCFEDDYRDFKGRSIEEILDEFRTRDVAAYRACIRRLGLEPIPEFIPA